MMHATRILLCTFLILLVHWGIDWWINQPKNVGIDVPSGKLMSLSFAPFREGYSPLEEIFPLDEQVEEDLSLLADKTHSIRTYSSLGGGIESTPALARKYGISMTQGAWLGYGYTDNKNEIGALRDQLKEFSYYRDFVGVSREVQKIFGLVEKISPIGCFCHPGKTSFF